MLTMRHVRREAQRAIGTRVPTGETQKVPKTRKLPAALDADVESEIYTVEIPVFVCRLNKPLKQWLRDKSVQRQLIERYGEPTPKVRKLFAQQAR